ncbi:hypothetical protein K474DRAFT_1706326 [Panus rudis PR-1116 ss-1]|nr:hypothetical protein K474DRAFT_1706326 [Panus rudis PR-1116 ss-1]
MHHSNQSYPSQAPSSHRTLRNPTPSTGDSRTLVDFPTHSPHSKAYPLPAPQHPSHYVSPPNANHGNPQGIVLSPDVMPGTRIRYNIKDSPDIVPGIDKAATANGVTSMTLSVGGRFDAVVRASHGSITIRDILRSIHYAAWQEASPAERAQYGVQYKYQLLGHSRTFAGIGPGPNGLWYVYLSPSR